MLERSAWHCRGAQVQRQVTAYVPSGCADCNAEPIGLTANGRLRCIAVVHIACSDDCNGPHCCLPNRTVESQPIAACRPPMSRSEGQQSVGLRTVTYPRVCRVSRHRPRGLKPGLAAQEPAPCVSLVPHCGFDRSGIHWGIVVFALFGSGRRIGPGVPRPSALLHAA